jgi:hypothetical protein
MKAIIKNIRKNHEEITVVEFTTEVDLDSDQLDKYVNLTFGYCCRCGDLFYKDSLNELGEYENVIQYACEVCINY